MICGLQAILKFLDYKVLIDCVELFCDLNKDRVDGERKIESYKNKHLKISVREVRVFLCGQSQVGSEEQGSIMIPKHSFMI